MSETRDIDYGDDLDDEFSAEELEVDELLAELEQRARRRERKRSVMRRLEELNETKWLRHALADYDDDDF